MPTQLQHQVVATAEALAVRILIDLSDGHAQTKILSGTTTRGPAFVYLCEQSGDLSVISIPAGGLRDRDPHDPTSRTRIATFRLDQVIIETGAYVESDGTVRAILAVHVPGHTEPDWEIAVHSAEEIGQALRALRAARGARG